MIEREFNLFLVALMFYSRIPVPKTTGYSDIILNRATRYFPAVGLLIGTLVALIFKLFNAVISTELSIILSMVAGIIITGAFHEDGFADVCDGFGGGYTKEQRLEIMKDSRIGTYGTIGLILILLLKFYLLKNLFVLSIPVSLLTSHGLSRFMPVLLILFSRYSRDDEKSKVKPIGKKISAGGFGFALMMAILPLFLFKSVAVFLIIVPAVLISIALMKYFEQRIDGYTGDCLGATQQISEISIYLSLLFLMQFGLLELRFQF